MKELLETLTDRFQAAGRAWTLTTGAPSQPSSPRPEETWFSGLAVEPAEFSKQLADLQLSLQRAGAPAPFSSPNVTH